MPGGEYREVEPAAHRDSGGWAPGLLHLRGDNLRSLRILLPCSAGVYEVPYSPLGGGSLSLFGKNIKRRWEYHGCGEEYNVEKMEKGSNIIFPFNIMAVGKKSIGEEGKGTEIWGRKSRLTNGVGEEYQNVWNFIHPCCPAASAPRPHLGYGRRPRHRERCEVESFSGIRDIMQNLFS